MSDFEQKQNILIMGLLLYDFQKFCISHELLTLSVWQQ
jgi:hypothetical protein